MSTTSGESVVTLSLFLVFSEHVERVPNLSFLWPWPLTHRQVCSAFICLPPPPHSLSLSLFSIRPATGRDSFFPAATITIRTLNPVGGGGGWNCSYYVLFVSGRAIWCPKQPEAKRSISRLKNLLRLIWLSDFYDTIILSMFLFLVHLSYSSNWNFNNENMILQGCYIIIRGGGISRNRQSIFVGSMWNIICYKNICIWYRRPVFFIYLVFFLSYITPFRSVNHDCTPLSIFHSCHVYEDVWIAISDTDGDPDVSLTDRHSLSINSIQ